MPIRGIRRRIGRYQASWRLVAVDRAPPMRGVATSDEGLCVSRVVPRGSQPYCTSRENNDYSTLATADGLHALARSRVVQGAAVSL